MKLVSTKRTPKELKKTDSPSLSAPDPYPYSTRLCLDKAVLTKLGISPKDFKVGQIVTVEAVASIKSLRMVQGKDYDTDEIELQIQQIGIESTQKSLKEAVSEAVEEAE